MLYSEASLLRRGAIASSIPNLLITLSIQSFLKTPEVADISI
ncbi:hypothetical protein [Allocoleopsis sp.]